MSTYRRISAPGGTYFFTVVTYRRQKFLIKTQSRQILRKVIDEVREAHPFTIQAWVLLPDHLHCLWSLPPGESNFSKRWGLIKTKFTKRAKELLHKAAWQTASQLRQRESTIWQRRFWEHLIRDDSDFQRHFDYIHYNPVRHGLVSRTKDWPYSTFHRYVREGIYPEDWGDNLSFESDVEFGE
jgi:putative transposase